MELAVDAFAVSVDQLEGVGTVAVHVAVAVRQASVAEQERHLRGKKKKGLPEFIYTQKICFITVIAVKWILNQIEMLHLIIVRKLALITDHKMAVKSF